MRHLSIHRRQFENRKRICFKFCKFHHNCYLKFAFIREKIDF